MTSAPVSPEVTATAPPAVKSEILAKLVKVPVKGSGRAATDPTAAILASLKALRGWAKEAPFLTPTNAAERKAMKDRGIVTRGQYVALIGQAEKAVKAAKTLVEVKPLRQPVGQALYFGARLIKDGGFVGATRPTGAGTYESGPPFAGTFSSRVQSA